MSKPDAVAALLTADETLYAINTQLRITSSCCVASRDADSVSCCPYPF